jgi:hypothetical protein
MNGHWVNNESSGAAGPLVTFQIQWIRADGSSGVRNKALDIYEHVARCILEGKSLAKWYHEEIT